MLKFKQLFTFFKVQCSILACKENDSYIVHFYSIQKRVSPLSIDPTIPTMLRCEHLSSCSSVIMSVSRSSRRRSGHSCRKQLAPVNDPSPPEIRIQCYPGAMTIGTVTFTIKTLIKTTLSTVVISTTTLIIKTFITMSHSMTAKRQHYVILLLSVTLSVVLQLVTMLSAVTLLSNMGKAYKIFYARNLWLVLVSSLACINKARNNLCTTTLLNVTQHNDI
jgi:hypothetical protein